MKIRFVFLFLIIFFLLNSALAKAEPSLDSRQAFLKGYQLMQKEKFNGSIRHFKIAIKDTSFPLADYAYFFVAENYRRAKHPKEAATVYKIVYEFYPDSVLAQKSYFLAAKSLINDKNYVEAAPVLQSMVHKFPNNSLVPQARYLLGTCFEEQKKYTDAARVYRNLDLLHPSSDHADQGLARLKKLAKKTDLAHYEAPAASVYNRGIKYFKARDYRRAKEYFGRIAKNYKKSSFHDEALIMLGRINFRKKKYKSALAHFKKSRNLKADSQHEALYYQSLTESRLGKTDAAIFTLQKLVEKHPNSHLAPEALADVAQYYESQNKYKKAVEEYSKLVDKFPNSKLVDDSLFKIGWIHFRQKDYRAAFASFSRAYYDFPPDDMIAKCLFWGGKSAEKIGNREEAVNAFQITATRFDHSYYGYRAKEKLKEMGIKLKEQPLADVDEKDFIIKGARSTHEKRYNELIALGLNDLAVEEAALMVEKTPAKKLDNAKLAYYHAMVSSGKFAKPIYYADKKLNQSTREGKLSKVDPQTWRFAYPRGYHRYVDKYSEKYGLDPFLTYAVIREESRFKPRALSWAYAHGLMQIIPSTGRLIARGVGMSYSRRKMYDPRVNIHWGTYYLSSLIKRFDGNIPLALAGYNGGPVRISRWRRTWGKDMDLDEFLERIPLRETRNYVRKVMKSYYGYKRVYGKS